MENSTRTQKNARMGYSIIYCYSIVASPNHSYKIIERRISYKINTKNQLCFAPVSLVVLR